MIKEQSVFLKSMLGLSDPKSKVRKAAKDLLIEIGLPNKKSEAYKYTPITSLLEKKIDSNLSEPAFFDKKNFYEASGKSSGN